MDWEGRLEHKIRSDQTGDVLRARRLKILALHVNLDGKGIESPSMIYV